MKPEPAPLTHKLILAVLALILACLVLLVGKSYWNERHSATALVRQETGAPAFDAADSFSALEERKTLGPQRKLAPAHPNRPTNQLTFQPARRASNTIPVNPGIGEGLTVAPATELRVDAASVPEIPTIIGAQATFPGGIWGRVTLVGTPPREVEINFGPSCGPHQPERRTTRHYVRSADGGLANVLVFVHQSIAVQNTAEQTRQKHLEQQLPVQNPTVAPVLLDQVGCMFEPYVMALQLGGTLRVRNSDPLLHNLHLTPRLNRERNIGQPVQGQVNDLSFDRPELFVRIKCDVHPWMFSYVTIVPHPYFSVTDTNGIYRIPGGLPSGRYAVTTYHLKANRGQIKSIDIQAGQEQRLDFEVEVPGTLERQSRVVRSQEDGPRAAAVAELR